jgi:hypothetical protein
VEKSVADRLVCMHHYSGKATKNSFISFLVNDGKGVLQLGCGVRPRMKHVISSDITAENYCEFDRMWLAEELPKNSESRVIGLLLSYLKQVEKHIVFVITYADESVGNRGTIYQATNAIEVEPVQVDFYVLPSGERVHPIAMYHRHGTRSKDFLEQQYPGIQHIRGRLKHRRYVYVLNHKMRKRFQGRNAASPMQRGRVGSGFPL